MNERHFRLMWAVFLGFCVIIWVFAIIGLGHMIGGCQIEKVEPAPIIKPTCPPTTGKEFQELKKWRSVTGERIESQ